MNRWSTRHRRWMGKGIVMVVCLVAVMQWAVGCGNREEEQETEAVSEVTELTVWYTDEGIEAYVQEAAEAYRQETGIVVTTVPMGTLEYLERLNEANMAEDGSAADVYILNSEQLEKAYLAGLVKESTLEEGVYPEAAEFAGRYQGRQFGYPFYYETSFLLYNKNFVETAPITFQEILDFSQQYGADGTTYEGVETILKWDVQNLYYNYGFGGAYFKLGGEYGDDASVVDVANESAVDALSFYKQLNQSLYFDAAESGYDKVLQEFIEGKILYTIVGSQSIGVLEEASAAKQAEAAAEGTDSAELGRMYGIAPFPNLNEELEGKAIATNYLAEINPYGQEEAAEKFAVFLTDTYVENLYAATGKFSSKPRGSYENEELIHVEEAYADSVQLPKLMKATDYWMEMEYAMNAVWNAQLEIQSGEGTEEEDQENQRRMKEEIRSMVMAELTRVQEQMQAQLEQ